MRRARITYPGAFHHVMNRGHDGEDIFAGNKNKHHFFEFLGDARKKMKIRLLAYCMMDNHYHLVLQNTSGKMSECLKRVNGLYGMSYRKTQGGKGYVFQNRFKSTLIDEDAYLINSIAYLLRNPVRSGMVRNAEDYLWSSINDYFSDKTDTIVDTEFVNELFGTKNALLDSIDREGVKEPPVILTKYGEVLGGKQFLDTAVKKFDRRVVPRDESHGQQRNEDPYFGTVEQVIGDYETKIGKEIEEIDVGTIEGKRQRGELLVRLKDMVGLTYKEIGAFEVFSTLRLNSLRSIYRNSKRLVRG